MMARVVLEPMLDISATGSCQIPSDVFPIVMERSKQLKGGAPQNAVASSRKRHGNDKALASPEKEDATAEAEVAGSAASWNPEVSDVRTSDPTNIAMDSVGEEPTG